MAWALQFNNSSMSPASAIPAAQTAIAALTITLKIKPERLDGTTQLILGNGNSNYSGGESFLGVYINSSNQLVAQCGNNASRSVTSTALTVNTYYDVVVTMTGLNTVTNGTAAGNLNLTINGSSIGDVTPRNDAFFTSFFAPFSWLGARNNTNEPYEGLIFEVGWTYDGNAHYWTAAASDRTNTGAAPVLTATQGGVNLTAVSGNSFPTDGSDWFDSSTGADTTAPVFTADPAVTATSESGHTFSATLDEDCTLYAVRLASGASAPTAAQIIAGTDAADVALASSEKLSSAYTATVSKNVTFTGGTISTEYDYYFAAQDAAANDSLVKTVTATTTAGTIAIDTDTLTAGAAFTGTYSGIASIASPITIQDSNSNQITVAITDNLDGTFSGTMPALPSSGSASTILFGSVTVSGNP